MRDTEMREMIERTTKISVDLVEPIFELIKEKCESRDDEKAVFYTLWVGLLHGLFRHGATGEQLAEQVMGYAENRKMPTKGSC